MDSHSSHLNAANRSRSSQTPSPSHSASVSSSLHKRKLAASEDHAPPSSNDDLESISAARGADSGSDPDESEDAVHDGYEEDFAPEPDQDSSIRTFTAARLDPISGVNGSSRNAKIKTEEISTVELEAGTGTAGAIVPKDESAKILTCGAYIAREEALRIEEDAGRLKFVCYSNDGVDDHMMCLIGLKNIFARQLPNMPKEYIVRLLMDRKHKSVMVLRKNEVEGGIPLVVGGITYRPYHRQRFGEIAFCAISADEQVKGYGTRLMNHLKEHARDVDGLTHFLTYADNNAVGYFVKQSFTKEIYLEKDVWHGYIKDYDGVLLMECRIDPKLKYTNLASMISQQRQAIDEMIRELSNCQNVYQVAEFQKKEGGSSKNIRVEDIPGLRDAGWTSDQWGHTRYKLFSGSGDSVTKQKQLNALIRGLLKTMQDHTDAWPFIEPVDSVDVPDYYKIIKDPIDLKTIGKSVESGASCDVSSSLSLSLFHIEFVLLRRNQAKISRGIEISSFRLGGRACGPGEAKLTSEHIVEGEPNRLKKSRDMSYSVYRTCMCVEEQKCDRVNQRGSHNKIHHTEEDIGSEEGYTESQRKRRS